MGRRSAAVRATRSAGQGRRRAISVRSSPGSPPRSMRGKRRRWRWRWRVLAILGGIDGRGKRAAASSGPVVEGRRRWRWRWRVLGGIDGRGKREHGGDQRAGGGREAQVETEPVEFRCSAFEQRPLVPAEELLFFF